MKSITEKSERNKIWSIEDVIEKLKRIRLSSKWAFFSAIVVGFLAHGYAFANKLPNSDDLENIRAYGAGLPYGRWLMSIVGPVVSKFVGNYSAPWVIGMISLLLLAASAAIIVEALGVESISGGIVIGGVLTSFPSITGNFLFMFVALYFSLSILMASGAIYFIVREKCIGRQIAGIVLISCSMGIYQAYFPFVASLLLCDLIKKCFSEKEGANIIFWDAIRYFACLVAGIVLYFVIEYFFLWIFHISLSAHKSINEMGHIELYLIPEIIIQILKKMISMLYSDLMGLSTEWTMRILIGVSYLTVILFAVVKGVKLLKGKEYLKVAFGAFFLAIFPISINLIDIMCANSGERVIYILMEYALSAIFILPVILIDTLKKPLLHWGMLLGGIGIIYCYVNVANAAYLYVDLAQRAVESYYTVMLAEIRGTEGYRSDMDIVFVGDIKDETIYPLKQEFSNIEMSSMEDVTYRVNWYRENFLKYYCGFTSNYKENYEEEYENVVDQMPCYPNYGSIQVLGDQVIVKLSDD